MKSIHFTNRPNRLLAIPRIQQGGLVLSGPRGRGKNAVQDSIKAALQLSLSKYSGQPLLDYADPQLEMIRYGINFEALRNGIGAGLRMHGFAPRLAHGSQTERKAKGAFQRWSQVNEQRIGSGNSLSDLSYRLCRESKEGSGRLSFQWLNTTRDGVCQGILDLGRERDMDALTRLLNLAKGVQTERTIKFFELGIFALPSESPMNLELIIKGLIKTQINAKKGPLTSLAYILPHPALRSNIPRFSAEVMGYTYLKRPVTLANEDAALLPLPAAFLDRFRRHKIEMGLSINNWVTEDTRPTRQKGPYFLRFYDRNHPELGIVEPGKIRELKAIQRELLRRRYLDLKDFHQQCLSLEH